MCPWFTALKCTTVQLSYDVSVKTWPLNAGFVSNPLHFVSASTLFCSLLCSTRQKTVNLKWPQQKKYLCKWFQAIKRVWTELSVHQSLDNLSDQWDHWAISKQTRMVSLPLPHTNHIGFTVQIGKVQKSRVCLCISVCAFMYLYVKEWVGVGDLNLLHPASLWENPPPLCWWKSCDWFSKTSLTPPSHAVA